MSNNKTYKYELTEIGFNNLLPLDLKHATRLFFTHRDVAETAAALLTGSHALSALGVVAGVGKFCVVAA